MNCQKLALPYSLLVGADVIYNGRLCCGDTPIEDVILNMCAGKSHVTDNRITCTILSKYTNTTISTRYSTMSSNDVSTTCGTRLNITNNTTNISSQHMHSRV